MKKILVPVAGDGLDDATLGYAKEFVDKMEAQLYIVTVIPYSDHLSHPYLAHYVGLEGQAFTDVCEEILKKTVGQLEAVGITPEQTAILRGDPASEIIDYAKEAGCDMILMHTHGMGIIKRFTMGSVTNTVVHHATMPVFVIR